MNSIIVRAFVVALALTGAVATTSTSNSQTTNPVVTRTSAYPIPSCPPGDPNACGWNSGN